MPETKTYKVMYWHNTRYKFKSFTASSVEDAETKFYDWLESKSCRLVSPEYAYHTHIEEST